VLLAEDSEDIQALIMMHLHKARLNARSVTNGVEAVREVSRWHFDLVLMDIQMPVMDGLTAIRQLRNQGVKTPIVALTASNTPEDKHQCLSSGADNFLVKPLDIDQFYALLSQYLSAQAPLAVPGNNEPSAQQSPTVGPQNMDQEMFDQEMQRLVQGFVSRLPQSVDEIATYYRRQQWHDLLTTSHRLKGAGGAFGFPELSELSRKIMDKVKRREYSELGELVESLRQRCRQITKKAG
jgi:CheY-like chemotaxis protein/HPt (histidine-containing phosphotransfer) domain-containing protein